MGCDSQFDGLISGEPFGIPQSTVTSTSTFSVTPATYEVTVTVRATSIADALEKAKNPEHVTVKRLKDYTT